MLSRVMLSLLSALSLASCVDTPGAAETDTAATAGDVTSTSATGVDQSTTTTTTTTTSTTTTTGASTADEATSSGETSTSGATTNAASSSSGGESTSTTTGGMTEDAECLAVPMDDPDANWSRRITTYQTASIRWPTLGVDSDGAVLMSGHYYGPLDLGSGPLDPDGGWKSFIVKYDAPCETAWELTLGGEESEIVDITFALDGAGGVVAVGSFSGTIDFGGVTLEATFGLEAVGDVLYATTDLFLARYTSDGELQWARRFGDEAYQRAHGVAVTDEDELILVGGVRGTVDLGNAQVFAGQSSDGLLAHFTADGEHVWHSAFSAPADVNIFDVEVSAGGLISIAGLAADGVEFGGGPLAAEDGDYEYYAQFESTGEHRWSRRFLPGFERRGFTADDDGAVYSTGRRTVDKDSPMDVFVLRFDKGGELAWVREGGVDMNAQGVAVAITGDGDVELVGTLRGTIDLGGGPISSESSDAFFVRFNPDGAVVSSVLLGVPVGGHVLPYAHRLGPAGERVTVGSFSGSVDFGAGTLESPQGSNGFIRRAAP